MDNYFQAAVVDLDKLLDDFEQNTDESENFQSAVATHSENQSSISSSEFYLKPDFPVHGKQSSEYTSPQQSLSFVNTPKNETDCSTLSSSSRGEKNVTGLDLLSCLDGGSSNEESSNAGRNIVPICDLISDTGSLIHISNSHELVKPGSSLCSKSPMSDLELLSDPVFSTVLTADSCISSKTDELECKVITLLDSDLSPESKSNLLILNPEVKDATNSDVSCLNDHLDQAPSVDSDALSSSSSDGYVSDDLPYETLNEGYTCHVLKEEENKSDFMESPERHKTTEEGTMELPSRSITYDADLIPKDPDSLDQTNEELSHVKKSVLGNVTTPECTYEKANLSSVSADHKPELPALPEDLSLCYSLTTAEKDCIASLKDNKVVLDTNSAIGVENVPGTISLEETDSNQENVQVDQSSLLQEDNPVNKRDLALNMNYSCSQISELPVVKEYDDQPHSTLQISSADFEEIKFCGVASDQNLIDDDGDLISGEAYISDAELDAFLNEESSHLNTLENNISTYDLGQVGAVHGSSEFDIASDMQSHEETSAGQGISIISTTCNTVEYPTKLHESALAAQPQNKNNIVKSSVRTGTEDNLPGSNSIISHIGGARPKQLFHHPPKSLTEEHGNFVNKDVAENMTDKTSGDLSPSSSYLQGTVYAHDGNDSLLTKPLNMDSDESPELSSKDKIGQSENVTTQNSVLGQKQPTWIPDSDAPNCMNCSVKFTFTKRRHHCRACGKVFCAVCCNQKCKLQYMDKEARVCVVCYYLISKVQAYERMMSPTGPSPNPNVPYEYCSTIPPVVQAQAAGTISSPPPTVLVPGSVLKHTPKQPGTEGINQREQKRVWFADGILPNGEVADTTKLLAASKKSSQDSSPTNLISPDTTTLPIMPACSSLDNIRVYDEPTKPEFFPEASCTPVPLPETACAFTVASSSDYTMLCGIEKCVSRDVTLLSNDDKELPPLLMASGESGDALVEDCPTNTEVMLLLNEEGPNPLTFILNANLLVNVKIVSYASERCWFFATNGLHGLGQAEVVVLLSCLENEDTLPKDMFKLFINLYKDAQKGKYVGNLENFTFTESFLGSKDHGGFLFFAPTFQDLSGLPLPNNPFLCGVIIQKMEVPWAKVFPIRLMLRLGAEYGVYPSPLTSQRNRKSVFGEIGHTIINLLTDLRNYQYTIPHVEGLFIHMEMGKSCIKIPSNRHNEILKVIHSSNEHVISIGASFSLEADSHLVCVQNTDGVYQTQANSATGKPREVTGASFVVFNGALKTSSGFLAKSSIVEDGLMVQITQDMMEALRQALRDKKDFRIACGKIDSGDLTEEVTICWVETEDTKNKGVTSPIDGQSMEGISSERICQEADFEAHDKTVKCTEVFYLLKDREPVNAAAHTQFAKEIATACGAALCSHMKTLKNSGMNKIGLRVSMDVDMVEYRAGSRGQPLPQLYLNDLDSALIPVIHNRTSDTSILPLVMELNFFLLENLN